MLTIRDSQLKVLREARFGELAVRLRRHLHGAVPGAVEIFGEEAVTQSAHKANMKCRSYGIEREYDVFRYFNIMYVLGFDFDTDA